MSDTMMVDVDLAEMLDGVFREYAESGASLTGVLDRQLWAQLDELGLVRLTGAEASGGSGAGWLEAAALLSTAARHGVRVPLGEHDLLAEWLREQTGMTGEPAVRVVATIGQDGRAVGVPWASAADRVMIVWQAAGSHWVADVAVADLEITVGSNLIGEPRDTVIVDVTTLSGTAVPESVVEQLGMRGALLRAVQVCAALDQALDLSVEHATTRVQFGRPLAKFQAVQSLLADMAGECALARSATEAAVLRAVSTGWAAPELPLLIATARSCAGHAATVVVRNAHQVHGAIGTTVEHPLHLSTRAALAWRSEFGSLASWDERVTELALRASGSELWSTIAGGR